MFVSSHRSSNTVGKQSLLPSNQSTAADFCSVTKVPVLLWFLDVSRFHTNLILTFIHYLCLKYFSDYTGIKELIEFLTPPNYSQYMTQTHFQKLQGVADFDINTSMLNLFSSMEVITPKYHLQPKDWLKSSNYWQSFKQTFFCNI